MPLLFCAFPGTGKTYTCEHRNDCCDSDSSEFSWITDENGNKIRNPDFPNNYIKHIEEKLKDDSLTAIFVSTHKEVRDALENNGIPFIVVTPYKRSKELYLRRYIVRGNDTSFINKLNIIWNNWFNEIDKVSVKHPTIFLGDYEYLIDLLPPEKKVIKERESEDASGRESE